MANPFTAGTFILILLRISVAYGQATLTGVISGENDGIPGATIRLLGTEHAEIADPQGKYIITDIAPGTYQVEVRSVGYKPQRQSITIDQSDLVLKLQLEESALTMNEVVVTGTMTPTFVSQSPVKIDVVTSDYLNTFLPAAASGVVEGVSLVNGVQEVVACGVCFTNSISINGLPGPYTAILMDGSPIYGNLASVYGLNGIPNMIIDRFEVIKGPNSTLYGSEAVAGVINIITKDPADQPLVSIDVMGTTQKEMFSNFSISPSLGRTSGFIGVNHGYITGFADNNEDGFGDNVNLDRLSLFTKWNIFRKSGKKFTVTGKYYFEDRRNGVEAFLRDRNYKHIRGNDSIYGESIYTNRFELFGTYELPTTELLRIDYSASLHDQDSYYGQDHYTAHQNILFANLIWNKPIGKHDLVLGITNRFQTYDDNTVATEAIDSDGTLKQYIPGIFLQDEWQATRWLTLLGGSRLDHYHEHGVIFSPRLSLKANAGKWTTFRTNFGTGFRIVNLFTEDHAFVTGQRQVIITEQLKPEESYNLSFNINHVYSLGESQGMIDVDAFYTHFTNKITPNYDMPGKIIYANTPGFAVSKGVGINMQHQFRFPLSLNAGMNFQEVTETQNRETHAIEFAPKWSGVFTSSYLHKPWQLSIGYSVRLTGPMALPQVYDLDYQGNPLPESRPTQSETWAIHDIQIQKQLPKGFAIYGGIQNLFNYRQPWAPLVGFNDPATSPGFSNRFDTSYSYSSIHGREFYFGLKWELNKN